MKHYITRVALGVYPKPGCGDRKSSRAKFAMFALAILYLSTWVATAVAQQSSQLKPDAIYYNGKVVTVDGEFRITEAFAVGGERFVAVGNNRDVKALAGSATRLTDLRGRTVIPGLMDNHNHQYNGSAIQFRGLEMGGVSSVADILDRLRRALAASKPGQTIFTNANWTEAGLREKRGPSRTELDQVSADRPIVVFRARGAVYMNSSALKAAGITRDTDELAGTAIPKDSTGEPSGMITGPATVQLATKSIVPPPTLDELKQILTKAQSAQHALGLTGIREVELTPEVMRAYWSLWRERKLTMRVSMGLSVAAVDADKLDDILRPWGVGTSFGDHQLRLDSIGEFAVDGVPNNAYLREPHLDLPDNSLGTFRLTQEQLNRAVLTMQKYGWRPAIHISGDKALDAVIEAYEKANAVEPIREKRWIVEHIPLVHPDQMERLANLGVLVSAQFQPYNGSEGMIRSWGKERAAQSLPMRDLLNHGLLVSAGSDWPGAGTNNPFVPLYFYVTRKTTQGTLAGASQKISREEALRASTINNAYMTFEENVKGSIEPGKLADFLVLSDDIMTVPEERIITIHPLATYVGGTSVYSAAEGF